MKPKAKSTTPPGGQFLVYQTEDGKLKLDVRFEGETVWLTQQHMAELFQTTVPNVSMHIHNVFAEGELQPAATVKESLIVRQDAARRNLGLTNWRGAVIRKQDVGIAKNYLTGPELAALNNLVEQYLVFAEGQAMRRVPMHMADWIKKLDAFLTLNERDILTHAGRITHEMALAKAEAEYEKFRQLEAAKPSLAEKDFEEAIKNLPAPKPGKPARKQK
jgi:hypothetical protein